MLDVPALAAEADDVVVVFENELRVVRFQYRFVDDGDLGIGQIGCFENGALQLVQRQREVFAIRWNDERLRCQ
jgi:hypothetical protein